MKKTTLLLTGIFALTAFATVPANAEVKLDDNSKIVGKWHVYAAAPALHKEKRKQDSLWEFKKDNTLIIKGKDVVSGRTGMMDIKLKYSIEDGKLKRQTSPGRQKFETCSFYELTDKDMTLKCTYLYYFLKKM
jgi:uncharacterized protein (TIGR03066 family)